jgi:transposase
LIQIKEVISHYLVDPVACTPASGWEKGQVENQIGLVWERFFTPRLLGVQFPTPGRFALAIWRHGVHFIRAVARSRSAALLSRRLTRLRQPATSY